MSETELKKGCNFNAEGLEELDGVEKTTRGLTPIPSSSIASVPTLNQLGLLQS